MTRYHFVGIGGSGMSAIAKVLLDSGYQVSGSDLKLSDAAKRLRDGGARVYVGHNARHVAGADAVVVSSAVPPGNEEVQAARLEGIPVLQRADMLARIMEGKRGIAVAGTHGKTTTTSMVGLMLERCGLDPTVLVGGELEDFGGNARLGGGDLVVAEADESDASFLKLSPYIAVITNVDRDHLDYYRDLEDIKRAFAEFLGKVVPGGWAVVCLDDAGARCVLDRYPGNRITYGISSDADVRAGDIRLTGLGSESEIKLRGPRGGVLRLNVPYYHNVSNALAAIAVGSVLGIELEPMLRALAGFTNAQRRFQTLAYRHRIRVVDDYGHHPTEIQMTLASARAATEGRVICIFQPHRYTRTVHLWREFGEALRQADLLVITDIYSAGEPPIEGVTAQLVVEGARLAGSWPVYIPDKDRIPDFVMNEVAPGDLVLTLGAGDIREVGLELSRRLKSRCVDEVN